MWFVFKNGLRVWGRCVTRFLSLKEEDNVSVRFFGFFFFFFGKVRIAATTYRQVNNPSM